jgi:DNA (cytosine-5)-methyltransferase 1
MKNYKLINFCEFDKYATQSYCAIHEVNRSINLGDITQVNVKELERCDLITHGSPCQSFSVIGIKEGGDEGSGTKSSLMWNSVEIIQHCNPKFVIWENVKAVLGKDNIHNFNKYIDKLNEFGYTSYYQVLNPKQFSIPQNRERLFVVSIRNDINKGFEFPKPYDYNADMFDYLDKVVDEKYIVPHQVMIGYKNKKSIFKKRFILKKPKDCAYCMTAKSGRAVITNNYVFNDFEMYKNPPCKLNDLDYLADNNIPIRSLTPLEYWRFQCYDESDFYKAQATGMSDAQLYKQAGNSINVKVIYEIFKQLKYTYKEDFDNLTYTSLFSGIGAFEVALRKLEINE